MRIEPETQHQIPRPRFEIRLLGLAAHGPHVAVADRFPRAARDHAGAGIQRQHAAGRPHPFRQARRQRSRAAARLVHPFAAQIAQAPAQALEPGLVLRLERQRVFPAGQGIEKGFAIHDGRG